MKYTIRTLLIVILAGFLSGAGCPLKDRGFGESEYTLNPDGTFIIKSGKEMAEVEAVMTRGTDGMPDMVYFHALGVKAFEGQQIQAEISKEVTKAISATLPAMLSTAIKGVMGKTAIETLAPVLVTP